jgi:hypothetical protein
MYIFDGHYDSTTIQKNVGERPVLKGTPPHTGAPPRARRARDPGGFNPHDPASDPTRAV